MPLLQHKVDYFPKTEGPNMFFSLSYEYIIMMDPAFIHF